MNHSTLEQQITECLHTALSPVQLRVTDESCGHENHAGGHHVRGQIVSERFAGLSRVASHRLVYDALQPFIDAGLHAVAIEASAPR